MYGTDLEREVIVVWDLTTLLGIKLSHLMAGVAGGIVRAFMVGNSFFAAFSSVMTGALTAAYMTVPVASIYTKITGTIVDLNFEHGIAFCTGLTAMLICEGVLRYVRKWSQSPTLGTGGS